MPRTVLRQRGPTSSRRSRDAIADAGLLAVVEGCYLLAEARLVGVEALRLLSLERAPVGVLLELLLSGVVREEVADSLHLSLIGRRFFWLTLAAARDGEDEEKRGADRHVRRSSANRHPTSRRVPPLGRRRGARRAPAWQRRHEGRASRVCPTRAASCSRRAEADRPQVGSGTNGRGARGVCSDR